MAHYQAAIHQCGILFAEQQAYGVIKEKGLLRRLPHGFSHFDYDSTNILVERGEISCILDFEGMHYGSLITCLYFTISRIYEQTKDTQKIQAYLRFYEQVRQLTKAEKLVLRAALALRYRLFTSI
jgi:Ser/Thr protein kinase RdoA (MazF antagonist)